MLKYAKAPDKPKTFDDDVSAAAAAVKTIANNRPPQSKEFADVWGKYEADFIGAQFDKCGYCELPLAAHPGDVEHFSPKAELQSEPANEKDWGQEGKGDYSVVGRRLPPFSDYGYWWRAYEWTNYLVACNRCNTGWKRNLFPVGDVPRLKPPAMGKAEIELLLNPFRGEDPADHLEYDKLGQVKARTKSAYGTATIQTCGLDRDSLVRARVKIAERAYELLNELADALRLPQPAQTDAFARARKDFRRMAAADFTMGFPGMVRAVFKQGLGLSGQQWQYFLGE
jgi:hypothetical protein